jgi:ferredoxin
MRVKVDWDFCQGHGVCCEEAPEVFRLNDDGEMELVQETPDESLRPKVEQAVRFCPTRALSIEG